MIQNIREELGERGLLWVLSRARLAEHFESVVVMERGKLIADQAFSELESNATMRELLDQD